MNTLNSTVSGLTTPEGENSGASTLTTIGIIESTTERAAERGDALIEYEPGSSPEDKEKKEARAKQGERADIVWSPPSPLSADLSDSLSVMFRMEAERDISDRLSVIFRRAEDHEDLHHGELTDPTSPLAAHSLWQTAEEGGEELEPSSSSRDLVIPALLPSRPAPPTEGEESI